MQDNSHKSVNEEETSRGAREGEGNRTVFSGSKSTQQRYFSQKIMRIFLAALRSNETGKQI